MSNTHTPVQLQPAYVKQDDQTVYTYKAFLKSVDGTDHTINHKLESKYINVMIFDRDKTPNVQMTRVFDASKIQETEEFFYEIDDDDNISIITGQAPPTDSSWDVLVVAY